MRVVNDEERWDDRNKTPQGDELGRPFEGGRRFTSRVYSKKRRKGVTGSVCVGEKVKSGIIYDV